MRTNHKQGEVEKTGPPLMLITAGEKRSKEAAVSSSHSDLYIQNTYTQTKRNNPCLCFLQQKIMFSKNYTVGPLTHPYFFQGQHAQRNLRRTPLLLKTQSVTCIDAFMAPAIQQTFTQVPPSPRLSTLLNSHYNIP